MKLCRFCFVFAAIGGVVLLLHDDASAGPSGPSTLTTQSQGIAQAAPVAPASATAPQQWEEESSSASRRGFLGVSVTGLTNQLRETFEVPEDVGVLIEEVESDSPASSAKLRAGDVIVSFDGEEIESGSQLARAIRSAGADTAVAVGFYRNGRFRQETVTLGNAPERMARWSGSASPRGDWDEKDWEEWGERFGAEMEARFEALGEQWEGHGEDWEQHWERNAEHWEQFGERWGEWGEQFGERMGDWGERFGERMAEWGERFGERFEEMGARIEARIESGEIDEHDWQEVQAEVHRALEEVDWEGLETEIDAAMNSVDWQSLHADIERDVRHQLDSIDWDEMNRSINEAVRGALRSLEEAGVLVERDEL